MQEGFYTTGITLTKLKILVPKVRSLHDDVLDFLQNEVVRDSSGDGLNKFSGYLLILFAVLEQFISHHKGIIIALADSLAYLGISLRERRCICIILDLLEDFFIDLL